jgi:hypothetical protein
LGYNEQAECGAGTGYCKVTLALGIVRRSCASHCSEGIINGITTRCCTTEFCNGPGLDITSNEHNQHFPIVPLANSVDKCYVCDSTSNRNCFNGFNLLLTDAQVI